MDNGTFRNLGRGETILLKGIVHWATLIGPGMFSLLILIFSFQADETSVVIWALLLDLLIMGIASIPLWSQELVITSKRLYGKTGVINTKRLDTPLGKINTVSVGNGLFGKLFGFGTVHVTSSSGVYKFKAIRSPDVFRQVLMEQIERYDDERIRRQAEEFAKAMR